MKRFGFAYKYLHNKICDSKQAFYIQDRKLGEIEAPLAYKRKSVQELFQIQQQRIKYQQYFNPLGLRPTLPYTTKKSTPTEKFVDIDAIPIRTLKGHEQRNCLYFRTGVETSKFELKQYLTKLYNLDIEKMTVKINQGKVKRRRTSAGYYLLPSYKKWGVYLKSNIGQNNKSLQKRD
jgi:ribosomal protein L23